MWDPGRNPTIFGCEVADFSEGHLTPQTKSFLQKTRTLKLGAHTVKPFFFNPTLNLRCETRDHVRSFLLGLVHRAKRTVAPQSCSLCILFKTQTHTSPPKWYQCLSHLPSLHPSHNPNVLTVRKVRIARHASEGARAQASALINDRFWSHFDSIQSSRTRDSYAILPESEVRHQDLKSLNPRCTCVRRGESLCSNNVPVLNHALPESMLGTHEQIHHATHNLVVMFMGRNAECKPISNQ